MHWIDPDSLPELQGTVERFVLNPHGEIDGFVMLGGEEDATVLVHTPPHMEAELMRHVKTGETVRVRGLRPRGAALFAAVAVAAQSGVRIVDEGPDDEREHPKFEKKKMTAVGQVRLSLFGPKGELRGALLTDGTVIRIGPKEAKELAELLKPNAAIAISGDGIETSHGRVIHAKEAGSEIGRLLPIKEAKPKEKHEREKHKEKHEKHGHGPKHRPRHEHEDGDEAHA
jgi:hypothetical protein